MKQYKKFKAIAPINFTDLMIKYWMEDEGLSADEVIDAYMNEDFVFLASRIAGSVRIYIPDLGYSDKSVDGSLCFEQVDNNFVIPVSMLKVVEDER